MIDQLICVVYNIGNFAGRGVRSQPRATGPPMGREAKVPERERCIRSAAGTR